MTSEPGRPTRPLDSVCAGPDAVPRPPSSFKVPHGAVDSHAHVIGNPLAHPFVADRSYTPLPASPGSYLDMLGATGLHYGVLVQVSVHGTDNGFMRAALRTHPDRFRGVAVMPLGLSARAYTDAHEDGIVALRLNTLYGGGVGLAELAEYGALAADLGWHLQLLVDAGSLAPLAPALSGLRVPVVIDHMGFVSASLQRSADPAAQALISLVRDGAWVKLSAAYRMSERAPFADLRPMCQALVDAAGERCLWGSDWLHVAYLGKTVNVGDLLDTLALCVDDPSARDQILVENPQFLFGFKVPGVPPNGTHSASTR